MVMATKRVMVTATRVGEVGGRRNGQNGDGGKSDGDFCNLVQNGKIGPHHDGLSLLCPNGTDLDRGVEKVPPASAQ